MFLDFNEKGELKDIIVLGHDITQLKEIENALIESKEKYSKIFERSPVLISITDLETGIYLDVNDFALSFSGFTRKEVIGKKSTEIGWISIENRNLLTKTLIENGKIENLEIPFKTKTGKIVYGIVNGERIIFNNRNCLLTITTDVSERKRIEYLLKEKNDEIAAQNEEYKQINEELYIAKEKAEESEVYIKEQKEEIVLNNQRLESLLKISQFQTNSIQELLDFALSESIELTHSQIGYIYFYDEIKKQFILNSWSKEVMKECAVVNAQSVYDLDKTGCWGEAVRQRKPIVMNDYQAEDPLKKGIPVGHVKLLKFLTIPVIFQNKIVAVAGVANKLTDYNNSDIRQLTLLMDSVWKISERISLIYNLKIAKEKAEEISSQLQSKNEEYEVINEELREANVELYNAKEKAEESDLLKSTFLQNMSHEVRTPLNSIVGFSKLITKPNQSQEKLSRFSDTILSNSEKLIGIITDVIEISQIQANQIKVKFYEFDVILFITKITDSFKAKAKEKNIELLLKFDIPLNQYFIVSDKDKLERIIIHLIDNAIKFTLKGSIEISCIIIDSQDLTSVQISVSDTGIGISSEMQKIIFEPFRQIETGITRNFGGNGLGLSIIKGYLELLNGSISLKSELNKGSAFTISIPIKKLIMDHHQNAINKKQYSANTILIAEDEYSNYQYLLELLGEEDLKILYAANGLQALQFCRDNSAIDLILMDIKMPIMDGHQAAKQIKLLRPDLPIIVQTAYALENEKEQFINVFDDYITKPIDEEILKQKLMKYIDSGK